MKYSLLIALAVFTLAACNSADKTSAEREQYIKDSTEKANRNLTTDETGNPNPETSILWLDSTYLDLGKVKEGTVVEVAFRFKNAGPKPLVITNVTASCGCTIPEKPEAPYGPGEEGIIKAKFDSKNQHAGEHRKHVTVTSNTYPAVHDLNFRVEVTE